MMLLNVQSMPGPKDILLTMEAIPTWKGFKGRLCISPGRRARC